MKTTSILIFTGLCSLATMQAMEGGLIVEDVRKVTPAQKFAAMGANDDKESILVYAAQENDFETVRKLLEMGVSINCSPKKWGYQTPLGAAAAGGWERMCEYLLQNEADINLLDSNIHPSQRGTPLMDAAGRKQSVLCKLLVNRGADVFKTNSTGDGALEWACEETGSYKNIGTDPEVRYNLCSFLVEKMLTLPSKEQKERIYTFLMCMKQLHSPQYGYSHIKNMFMNYLKRIIAQENKPVVIERVNRLWSIPEQTSKLNRHEAQEYLLATYFQKGGVLWDAVERRDVQEVRWLLHQGADPDGFVDVKGVTPLVHSIINHQQRISALLLEAGASVFHYTISGFIDHYFPIGMFDGRLDRMALWTPLGIAFEFQQYDLCSLIIERMIALDHKRAYRAVDALPKGEAKSALMRKHWVAGN